MICRKADLLVTSSHLSLNENQPAADNSCRIRHGDDIDSRFTCIDVCLSRYTTKEGVYLPSPWDENSALSKEHLSRILESQVRERTKDDCSVPETHLARVVSADEDATKLHISHSQKDSADEIQFSTVLNRSYSGLPDEKIICQLKCKGILNTASFNTTQRDIVGDCRVVLTESSSSSNRFRRIYLYQATFHLFTFFTVALSHLLHSTVSI